MTTEVHIVDAAIVRPGDTLMISLPPNTTPEAMADLATKLREKLGDEVGFLFIPVGATAHVLRPGQMVVS